MKDIHKDILEILTQNVPYNYADLYGTATDILKYILDNFKEK